jgi:hypothetical protein
MSSSRAKELRQPRFTTSSLKHITRLEALFGRRLPDRSYLYTEYTTFNYYKCFYTKTDLKKFSNVPYFESETWAVFLWSDTPHYVFSWNAYFYIHGSVHRDSILIRSNEMQQYAGIYLLQNYSTCFGCPSDPSPGEHKNVTAASGTATIFLQRGLIRPRWRNVVAPIIWPVPEAVVTVLCSPDDGCDGHPKHVESDFALNKYLHTVASCWILLT